MRVISCDPGYERLGVSVIEGRGSNVNLVYSDCIQTNPKEEFKDRLLSLGNEFLSIIKKYKPEILSIEKLIFSSNQKTAMMVAEARGVLLYEAARAGLKVVEYTPSEIKLAVGGHGRSDKKQIISMVPKLINIEKQIKYDDEFDAIAIGLTALASLHRT